MRFVSIITLLLSAALSACGRHDTPASPDPRAPRAELEERGLPTAVIRTRLEHAADGLLYTSESDYPFVWYQSDGFATTPLTEQGFRVAARLSDAAVVETTDLDVFFARHIERVDPNDPAQVAMVPHYRHLRETIRRTLPDVRVYRVGRIAIDCYIVGTDSDGRVVGLTTIAIET